jgi:hypothetical protein
VQFDLPLRFSVHKNHEARGNVKSGDGGRP